MMCESAVYMEQRAKSYMDALASARRDMRRLVHDREQMRADIDGLKAVRYDKQGGSGGIVHGDDQIAAIVIRLEAIDEAICRAAEDAAAMLEEWAVVSASLDPMHAGLLSMHYLDGMPWDDVAAELNVSVRTVYYHRMDALTSLFGVMPPSWR